MPLLNELINRFVNMAERGVYIRRMVADAITPYGRKICELFGMSKVNDSSYNSTIYEVQMIPPRFRVISQSIKRLYDCYSKAYLKAPYLFDQDY